MGAVYEAKHTVIGKQVAIKVLLDKHAEKDLVVARLKQEARLASSIGHDNIVDITDFGTTITGRTFVVMEYLDGESLGARISREGKQEELRTIRIGSQIASALAAAHKKGIVHRDIKPENIFLITRKGEDFVKVVDFGISKSMSPAEDEDVRLTQTGMVLGTPLYMSPEQARGSEELDHRIDIYALGVILYESITGQVPFQGKNYLSIITQVIADEPRNPSELVPGISRDLESVILKAMAKDPEQRYQSMDELAEDLAALDDADAKTTGARITAARWRQRRERRSKKKLAGWTLGIVGVGSVSTLTATMLMNEGTGKKTNVAEPVPALATQATSDAQVVPIAKAFDANLGAESALIHLSSHPTGAAVFHNALRVCKQTPCDYQLALSDEPIELHAKLEGYLNASIEVTPSFHNGKELHIELTPVPTKKKRVQSQNKVKEQSDPEATKKGPAPQDNSDMLNNPFRKK
jgi:serine/threonine-protein kinase